MSLALGDPTALVVTAGGHWWGMPVQRHPRWGAFLDGGGVYGVLVVSALSGAYYGLHIDGRHHERFVEGIREEALGVEAVVECADGSQAEIIRTTIGLSLTGRQETVHCSDLPEAFARIGGVITSVEAPAHPEAELAAALERGGVLPDRSVALNGRVWLRRPGRLA